MVIEKNTLLLDNEDCQLIEEKLKEGIGISEIITQQTKDIYKGSLDQLDGIEIPSEYWYFVNEFTKDISLNR